MQGRIKNADYSPKRIMKTLKKMKKSYEEANPGKEFILFVKEIFDDVIKELDREIIQEIFDSLENIKKAFSDIDPDSELSSFFHS